MRTLPVQNEFVESKADSGEKLILLHANKITMNGQAYIFVANSNIQIFMRRFYKNKDETKKHIRIYRYSTGFK